MQLNSYVFILGFLPIVIIVYYFLCRVNSSLAKLSLVISSCFFYFYSIGRSALVLFLFCIVFNYLFSAFIIRTSKWGKVFLVIPIVMNAGLLLVLKYSDFAVSNINALLNVNIQLKQLIVPVGISFITFQQIAYVVSVYKNDIRPNLIDYLAYILYFPKILMGPLMEPSDFIHQINDCTRKKINWDNIARGIRIFSFGLLKKVMIADVLAIAVSWGYENLGETTAVDWILIMIFYTFEIYFDFSGYCDMATGASLLLNIELPINFNSPYKALSIRDFWKRWHISLTQFFTKYIYIPLGGSRKGYIFTYINTMIVFLISGLWHGANWTFIIWGSMHGLLMVLTRMWNDLFLLGKKNQTENKILNVIRWAVTFFLINILWLLFRSDSVSQYVYIVKTMFLMKDRFVSSDLVACFSLQEFQVLINMFKMSLPSNIISWMGMVLYVVLLFAICLVPENNYKSNRRFDKVSMIMAAIAFVWGVTCLGGESIFVYYNF